MSGEYEHMGRGELLARLEDWMRVATDRGVRIAELEAERDLFRDEAIPQAAAIMNSLTAERDRLRVVVERAHDHVAADEVVLRGLDMDDLIALVGVLRRDYADARQSANLANAAADAAAEAVGAMAGKLSELLEEQGRWRAVVAAARATVAGIEFQSPGGVTEPVPINRLADLAAALRRLDVSREATDG